MKKDEGGPAFPTIETEPLCESGVDYSRTYSYGGMSLRDWFAGQAINMITETELDWGGILPGTPPRIAQFAYAIADAMLKEREK